MLTAGLCRWLARQGVRVAPFKAQNMSLNSFVTADGAEIGRAQAMQAAAAGIEPDARMNPVLLKPGSDRRSQVVVLGRAEGEVDAADYRQHAARLLDVATDSLAQLRHEYDVVICEGAGSPAEINLRATDIANMGLARAAGLPVIVVGDIDRGGVFAAMHGTLALLEPADQALVAGFVINKFRGAPRAARAGSPDAARAHRTPPLGIIPWTDRLWLDPEDSLALDAGPPASAGRAARRRRAAGQRGAAAADQQLHRHRRARGRAGRPGPVRRLAAELADADLVVLPGTRATVADLAWLRDSGMAEVIAARAAKGLPVLGICGGYQMLGREIDDEVESGRGPGGRAGRAAGAGGVRGAQAAGPARRDAATARMSPDTRSITGSPPRTRAPSRSLTAAGPRPPGGRAGTGRWKTTRSGGRS